MEAFDWWMDSWIWWCRRTYILFRIQSFQINIFYCAYRFYFIFKQLLEGLWKSIRIVGACNLVINDNVGKSLTDSGCTVGRIGFKNRALLWTWTHDIPITWLSWYRAESAPGPRAHAVEDGREESGSSTSRKIALQTVSSFSCFHGNVRHAPVCMLVAQAPVYDIFLVILWWNIN